MIAASAWRTPRPASSRLPQKENRPSQPAAGIAVVALHACSIGVAQLGCGLTIRFDDDHAESSWIDRLKTCLTTIREGEIAVRRQIEIDRRNIVFVLPPTPFRVEMEKADKNAKPDPGRVVAHRLNRNEYANTIRDLLGVEFRAQKDFPTDDSGEGFDNIGAILTISPVLMEDRREGSNLRRSRGLRLLRRTMFAIRR